MTQLIGIAGSLRQGSFNRALLRQAGAVMPAGSTLEILAIDEIPLYNGDLEQTEGIPPAVAAIQTALGEADGLVLATPEYNAGIPGVLKNAVDWLSRPTRDNQRILHGIPVALLGATPGGFGTAAAQSAWLPVLRALRMPLWIDQGALQVSRAHQFFTDGELTDEKYQNLLTGYMAGFVNFLRARHSQQEV